jgi:hypothetical protein
MLTTTATHFEVLAPPSVAPGATFDVTVRALDQFNNLVTDYTGPVHFTSSDGAAMVPADTTQTTGVGGYVAMLSTVGNQTISVVDTTNNISGTSGLIAVGTNTTTSAATSVVLSATPNPSALGQLVTFTATVSSVDPANGTPTGSVQFIVDGSNFGAPVALSAGGAASVSDSALSVGTHTVTATYSGDSLHDGSTSSPLTQTVLSVEQQVQIIQDQVTSLGLNAGNQNSLLVKLHLKGNHGDIGKVGAFIHELKAMTKTHRISQTDSDMLIGEAHDLLISLRFVETTARLHGATKHLV